VTLLRISTGKASPVPPADGSTSPPSKGYSVETKQDQPNGSATTRAGKPPIDVAELASRRTRPYNGAAAETAVSTQPPSPAMHTR
jgi:hypothetical protein